MILLNPSGLRSLILLDSFLDDFIWNGSDESCGRAGKTLRKVLNLLLRNLHVLDSLLLNRNALNILDSLLLNSWNSLNILDSLLLNSGNRLNYADLRSLKDWLLDLDSLLNLLNRLVDDLFLNSLVFNSLLESLLRDVLNVFVLIDLRNVFSLIFDGVVVGDLLFFRNVFNALDGLVFNNWFLIRNVFNARFTLNNLSGGCHSLRLNKTSLGLNILHLLDILNRLSNNLRLDQRLLDIG